MLSKPPKRLLLKFFLRMSLTQPTDRPYIRDSRSGTPLSKTSFYEKAELIIKPLATLITCNKVIVGGSGRWRSGGFQNWY